MAQQLRGCGGRKVAGSAAGEQVAQQRVQLIDQPHPALRQIHSRLIEQGQGIGDALSLEWATVALQRGHAGCCRSVDLVVLAATTTRELPHSGGRSGGHVDDLLAAG